MYLLKLCQWGNGIVTRKITGNLRAGRPNRDCESREGRVTATFDDGMTI